MLAVFGSLAPSAICACKCVNMVTPAPPTAGHEVPIMTVLAVFGTFISYICFFPLYLVNTILLPPLFLQATSSPS